MSNRWGVLALLFFLRATMAAQFQSVATVAPILSADFAVSLTDIGILVGLYSVPGIVLALPGGAIGQRFGDKTTVVAGLVLMIAGSCMMALSPAWVGQIAGRLVSGIGGVLMAVLMTKMVADWFVGKELSTAMAILVNSWPIGIAASLLVLPPVGVAYGAAAVDLAVAGLIAIATCLIVLAYRSPSESTQMARSSGRLSFNVATGVACAGLIWGLYNIAFVMIFGFGPSMLVERGWSLAAAGSTISIVLWLSAVSVPLGGVLADRTGRHGTIMVSCFLVTAALMLAATRIDAVIPVVVALGAVSGLAAGPIMSLPARVLQPDTRALGMGLYFSISYVGLVLGPSLGGMYATRAGGAAATFDLGAAVLLVCPMIFWVFQRFTAASGAMQLQR